MDNRGRWRGVTLLTADPFGGFRLVPEQRRRFQYGTLLLSLLAFYCAPQLIVFVISIWNIASHPSHRIVNPSLLLLLRTVSESPGATFNILHQMMMPVIAAVTAFSSNSVSFRDKTDWMFVIPLAALFITLINSVLFQALAEYGNDGTPASVLQLFTNTAGNLAVYVMLLVGLRLEPEGTT